LLAPKPLSYNRSLSDLPADPTILSSHEGTCKRQKDLRELQGRAAPWKGVRGLHERPAQAAPGLIADSARFLALSSPSALSTRSALSKPPICGPPILTRGATGSTIWLRLGFRRMEIFRAPFAWRRPSQR
jgi:hypothetical protein